MARQPLIRGADLRRLAIAWLVLVLLAAVVNVPWAVSMWRWARGPMAPNQLRPRQVTGSDLWPAPTPHAGAWPPPTDWSEVREFGYTRFDVRTRSSQAGRNGYAMDVNQYGWPLPVIRDMQMWWDWNDPTLNGPIPDPPPHLLWRGVILNPLMLGTAAFVVAVVPIAIIAISRRAWRRHGGQCDQCGYPIGVSAVCTECGAPVPGRA